jgi:hypothetical protein
VKPKALALVGTGCVADDEPVAGKQNGKQKDKQEVVSAELSTESGVVHAGSRIGKVEVMPGSHIRVMPGAWAGSIQESLNLRAEARAVGGPAPATIKLVAIGRQVSVGEAVWLTSADLLDDAEDGLPAVLHVVEPPPLVRDRDQLVELTWVAEA